MCRKSNDINSSPQLRTPWRKEELSGQTKTYFLMYLLCTSIFPHVSYYEINKNKNHHDLSDDLRKGSKEGIQLKAEAYTHI